MKPKKWITVGVMTLVTALAVPLWMAAQDNPSPDQRHRHSKYKVIDLGTLGGPASYPSYGGLGTRFLNTRGVVAGYADTPFPDPYAPNCSDLDCFLAHGFRWQDGVSTDLGSLPGVNNGATGEINARGWIVGASQNGVLDPITGLPESRAVLWKDGHIINLGTLGGNESLAIAINDRGQVAGIASDSIPDNFCFFGWGTQCQNFLWENGVMTNLGTLGGPESPPFGNISINESGQVAGSSFTNSIPNPVTGLPTADPYLWQSGKMTDLGTLGGTLGFPFKLNDRGQVVGTSNLAGDLTAHPFLWDHRRGILDLGTLGGDNGQAGWVNNGGDVVGAADLPGSQVHDAFLWRHGVMTDLGNLGKTSFAYAINEQDQVVGASRMADGTTIHAFLWEGRGPMTDLNDLIPSNSPLELAFAENINDRGEIVGAGAPAGCQTGDIDLCGHVFLLIPDGDCDENNEARIAANQNRIAAERTGRALHPAIAQRSSESSLTPVDRFRNMTRQRYHLPGQPVAPRD